MAHYRLRVLRRYIREIPPGLGEDLQMALETICMVFMGSQKLSTGVMSNCAILMFCPQQKKTGLN